MASEICLSCRFYDPDFDMCVEGFRPNRDGDCEYYIPER